MVQENTLPLASLVAPDGSAVVVPEALPGTMQRVFRRRAFELAAQLSGGRLEVTECGRTHVFGDSLSHADLSPRIRVHDPRAWEAVALRGTVGFAEAWMEGWLDIQDPTALVRLFVRNREVLEGMEKGLARFAMPMLKFWHSLRRNTKEGSRRNIAAHYDLGNEFYRLWLDETMMYSSAVWERRDDTLFEASTAKLDRICRKLRLKPGSTVIEIGTGWGGFAVHAAKHYGARVTTTTISREQHAYAVERVKREGVADRVTVLLEDYRDLTGTYDHLVSIEMIEAVGWQFFDTYHRVLSRLLKPGGTALVQAITIADRHYESARRSVDFIQRYIFPGSCIPSLSALLESARRSSDLTAIHVEDFGLHYGRTLQMWRERFLAQSEAIQALGFDRRFLRMWEWYLAYCEGGFLERQLGVAHIVWAKPGFHGDPILGRF